MSVPTTDSRATRASLLCAAVGALRSECLEIEHRHEAELARIPASQGESARNLLHYVALRQHDLRELQPRLSELGLSSLGRSEAHVLPTLDAVLIALHALAAQDLPGDLGRPQLQDFRHGTRALNRQADQLLGAQQPGRCGRIMVTMPSEAARDYALVRDLVAGGMDVMRVNFAHDDPEAWGAMVRHLRRARGELERECKLMCDLAGPKLRTGELEPGPRLLHLKPRRDARGLPVAPRAVWLHAAQLEQPADLPAEAVALSLSADLAAALRAGDKLQIEDARGKQRTLRVREIAARGAWAELHNGLWVLAGAAATLLRDGRTAARGRVGELPARAAPLALARGDGFLLARDPAPGHPRHGASPARIPCTLPSALEHVRVGERVLFDDGKIACEVERRDPEGLWLRVTHTASPRAKLNADRGINLPDSRIELPDLTPDDIAHLDFAAEHADIVGLSFVSGPESVAALQAELERRSPHPPAIVAKIETRRAFDALPRILLAGLCRPPFGVLIARGDLAVEVGFQRLAEVQEEILWMCEAAHVPTIWATQVLDTLAHTGSPTRAEVTDAAMSSRAECAMLNKGPYILAALAFLEDVQRRMHAHTEKKTSLLRSLRLTSGL